MKFLPTFVWLVSIVTSALQADAQSTELMSDTLTAPHGSASGASDGVRVSIDGQFVAFESDATDLVEYASAYREVYWVGTDWPHDKYLVSRGLEPSNGPSGNPRLGDFGYLIAFDSCADNLVQGDTNGVVDVFAAGSGHVEWLVSASVTGGPADGPSRCGAVASRARLVLFDSEATNLVPGDTNGLRDVFVRDLQTSTTTRVSAGAMGVQGDGDSTAGAISADGRYVVFTSAADGLTTNDGNGLRDVFWLDRWSGSLELVTVGSDDDAVAASAVTPDGRFVVFTSRAANLAPGDTNGRVDVFVRDRLQGSTKLVSCARTGLSGNAESSDGYISDDGRYIAFSSFASDLVADDFNHAGDVFVRDMWLSVTRRIDAVASGSEPNRGAGPVGGITSDGRIVTFTSRSTNLAAADANVAPDAFLGRWQSACFRDADGDGFGSGEPDFDFTGGCPFGWAAGSGDCDDESPAVHPGASESCNGIDDDCNGAVDDGALEVYCESGWSTNGCQSWMSAAGVPSSSATSGFVLAVHGIDGLHVGTIVFGLADDLVSWSPHSQSFKCVANPAQRMTLMSAGGHLDQCDGRMSIDFNAWRAAHPVTVGAPYFAGQVLYSQGWYRDPEAPGRVTTSNAIRFTLCD